MLTVITSLFVLWLIRLCYNWCVWLQLVLLRDKLKQVVQGSAVVTTVEGAAAKEAEVFLSQLTALSTPRNVRTRRLAQAQDNPEMAKTAKLAQVFRSLYNAVAQAKGMYATATWSSSSVD